MLEVTGTMAVFLDHIQLLEWGLQGKGSAQNRANLYAKPFASHETAVELVLAVEEDVVPPDRADMGQ